MGACASVPKAMKAEAADVPAPEPPMVNPATESVEGTTAVAEAKEEEAAEMAEGGIDAKLEKAVEIDAQKEAAEVETKNAKTEAPAPLETEAATEEEVAEQK